MHGISSLECFKGFYSHLKIIALLELVNRGSFTRLTLCLVVFGCVVMPMEMLVCSSTWRPTAVQRHLRQQALVQLNSCQVEEKSSLVKSAFVKHGRFLTFLLVELFKGQILIDPPFFSALFFYFSPAPPVSIPSPAPKVLQVGAERKLNDRCC